MGEDNSKMRINLRMGKFSFPMTIASEDEEIIRESAKQVNLSISRYTKDYPTASTEQILTMVAYDYALKSLQQGERNDTEPYTTKVKELTEMLENYFKKE